MPRLIKLSFFALCTFFLLPMNLFAQDLPDVMVSIAPQKFFVEKITGDTVKVTVLVNEGSDPHSFEPSPSQMRAASKANLYFAAGIAFEKSWIEKLSGLYPSMQVVKLGFDGISDDSFHATSDLTLDSHEHDFDAEHNTFLDANEHEVEHNNLLGDHEHNVNVEHNNALDAHDHGEHLWLSVKEVRKMVPVLLENLIKIRPDLADLYTKNAESFITELDKMDLKFTEDFSKIDEKRRMFISFHPAWGVFVNDYGLTEVSIEVDGKEPGARTVVNLIKFAKENSIRAIFIEPQFPKAMANNIAESIGAEVYLVNPLSLDWINSLYQFEDNLLKSMQ